jgi:hypothetical protein
MPPPNPKKTLENIRKSPHRNEYEGDNLISTINALDPKLVLDLGCGYNKYKGLIKGVVGIDGYDSNSAVDINDTILNVYNDGIFEPSSADAILCFGCGSLGNGGEIDDQMDEKEHQELEAIRYWSKNGAIVAMRGWTPWCDKIDKISSMYDFELIKEPVIYHNIYNSPHGIFHLHKREVQHPYYGDGGALKFRDLPVVGDRPPDRRYRRWQELRYNFPDGTTLSEFIGKKPIDIYKYYTKNGFSDNALRISWWWRVQK